MQLKRILMIVSVLLVLLVPTGITLTVGWRPFIGPSSRSVTDRKFQSTPARLQRGDYLVNAVAGCFGCHSEPDTTLPDFPPKQGFEGAGQFAGVDPTLGSVYMPNITPDKETGIGNWTDDEITRAVREGIGRDGLTLFPIMPYDSFRSMSDEDLASVVVYLRSIPAVRHPVPKMRPPFLIGRLVMSAPQPITQPVSSDLSTPLARGTYLVTLASCRHCHTPTDSRGQPKENLTYAGGSVFETPLGKKLAALNLTQDPSGISYFDESIFMTMIRNGKYGARTLKPPCPGLFIEI